ncbi:MAG: subclass B1 metallo-beta-lactamase [Bacteroidetes bacterium]|nr:subclass B1 metallo-beta-lactamase [Bacteroidota bacterium]
MDIYELIRLKILHGLSILFLFVFYGSLTAQIDTSKQIRISGDVFLYPVNDYVYLHVAWKEMKEWGRVPANGMLVVTGREGVLLDTPWDDEQTRALCDWAEDSLGIRITHVIAGHSHEDCMGGLAEMHRRGALSYSCALTKDIAVRQGLPVPRLTFGDSIYLNLGRRTFGLFYPGVGHTIDNILVWLPGDKILFAGCFAKSMSAKTLGNTAESDLELWPVSLKKTIQRFGDAQIVIPGHGDYGGAELLDHTLKLLGEHNAEEGQ